VIDPGYKYNVNRTTIHSYSEVFALSYLFQSRHPINHFASINGEDTVYKLTVAKCSKASSAWQPFEPHSPLSFGSDFVIPCWKNTRISMERDVLPRGS